MLLDVQKKKKRMQFSTSTSKSPLSKTGEMQGICSLLKPRHRVILFNDMWTQNSNMIKVSFMINMTNI